MLEKITELNVRLCPPCKLSELYDFDDRAFQRDTDYLCPSCEILWRPAPELAAARRAEHPVRRRTIAPAKPRVRWLLAALGTGTLHLAACALLGTFPFSIGAAVLMLLMLATGIAGVVFAVQQAVRLTDNRMRIRRMVRQRTVTSESLHQMLHTGTEHRTAGGERR